MFLHTKLENRKEAIRIAFIGCGKFVSMFLAQYNHLDKIKIDTIIQDFNLEKYKTIIKLDIEGNEMGGIQGSLNLIERSSPLIIIEFSRYIFNKRDNIEYLKNFLINLNF